MAKSKTGNALARLTPKSTTIPINGLDVRVPTDKTENSVLNMLTASYVRAVFEATLKKYSEQDAYMTTKELKDITEAAANIAKFSGEVYAGLDGQLNQLKKIEPVKEEAAIDFDEEKPTE